MPRIPFIVLCASLAGGCCGVDGAPAPTTRPTAASAAAPESAATTRPARGAVMARVNGEPIAMDALYDLLLCGPGLQYARELVRHEVVFQAAREKGLTVTDDDLEAERERFLETIAPQLAPAERQQVLAQIMSRKQVSQKQWRMMLRARVMLRKLAAEGLDVPAEAVREEFHRRYGRKVVVRHIQTDALSEAQKVRKLAQKEGADFAELAREHSVNPSGRSGGELPPIGRGSDSIPAGIREAALAMKEPGELSNPVQVGDSFHILRLVRTIEPEDVKFEEVEAEMRQAVRERLLAARQQQVLRELLARADVEYVHPTLKHQHRAAQPDAPLQP